MHLREENSTLESLVTSLQYKLSLTEEQLQITQTELQKQLEETLTRIDALEADSKLAAQERDKAKYESEDLREKCQGQTKTIDALTQQMARSVIYRVFQLTTFRGNIITCIYLI